MEEQTDMETTIEDGEPTYRFSPNPAVDSIMSTVSDQAEYYRLAVGVLTGRFDTDYATWKGLQSVESNEVGLLPNVDSVVEWMHIDANLSELLMFKDVVDKLATELNLAIFGHYAKKNVRGTVHHKVEDLQPLRKALITMLDGTVVTCSNVPMLKDVTVELLESIPSVGKQKPFGDGKVWDFPDAPSVEKTASDKAAAVHGVNLRKHNTNVKFVVDGKLPEEDAKTQLGDLCAKYFDKSTQDVGKIFGGWAKEYFTDGKEEPTNVVERDGKRYWLTVVGK